MSLKIVTDRHGQVYVSGLQPAFAKYERDIVQGKVDCPFRVEFRASTIRWRPITGHEDRPLLLTSEVEKRGQVVRSSPVPLTPQGKAKLLLF